MTGIEVVKEAFRKNRDGNKNSVVVFSERFFRYVGVHGKNLYYKAETEQGELFLAFNSAKPGRIFKVRPSMSASVRESVARWNFLYPNKKVEILNVAGKFQLFKG